MMSTTVLYIFNLKKRSIAFAMAEMAWGRSQARKIPGVTFAKLMGTGTGQSFTPRDADLQKWALLFVTDEIELLDQSRIITRWSSRAIQSERFLLNLISSHGRWSGTQPFTPVASPRREGPVVAITRARLKWSQALRFWRSIPPVVEDLHQAPGLILSFGIGEAPIGLQGTFSLWRTEGDLRNFAYKSAPHHRAIADTEKFAWYSEELFARFELINTADFHYVN